MWTSASWGAARRPRWSLGRAAGAQPPTKLVVSMHDPGAHPHLVASTDRIARDLVRLHGLAHDVGGGGYSRRASSNTNLRRAPLAETRTSCLTAKLRCTTSRPGCRQRVPLLRAKTMPLLSAPLASLTPGRLSNVRSAVRRSRSRGKSDLIFPPIRNATEQVDVVRPTTERTQVGSHLLNRSTAAPFATISRRLLD